MTHIVNLRIYPLKGARGQSAQSLVIDSDIGVVGDRQYAIKRKPSVPDGTWVPKGMLVVAMNDAGMAAEPSENLTRARLADIGDRLGVEGSGCVLQTGGIFNLTDSPEPYVSFVNLASVRALSEHMEQDIDPARFRMNVWLEGLPAFEELTWVNQYPGTREIRINGTRFRVEDACERCKATEANPETGQFDLNVQDALKSLMDARGYISPHRKTPCVMGILARPLSHGTLFIDSTVTPL